MKYRITRKKYSIVLGTIALTTAAFLLARTSSQPAASAQIQDGSVRFLSNSILGMTLGQTVRVCIGTTDPRGPVLDWSVRFSDQDGTLLFQLLDQRSPGGEWRCGNIARSMLPVAGDAGTGRAQVAMQVVVKAPAGTNSSEFIGSADLIAATGTTQAYLVIQFQKVITSGVIHGSSSPE